MGKASRVKGANAELEIAKMLQGWWANYEPDTKFARTPGSGGWGSKELRAGFKASGDLMVTSGNFPFVVEVKRREAGSDQFIKSDGTTRPHPAWGWWVQATKAAAEMGGVPLLVFRRSRAEWRAFLPRAFAEQTRLHVGMWEADVEGCWSMRPPPKIADCAPVFTFPFTALLSSSHLKRIVSHVESQQVASSSPEKPGSVGEKPPHQ
jgi:hypothetical protein